MDLYYVIFSPTARAWRNEDGKLGLFVDAEKFKAPNNAPLDGDQRWVGPLMEGDQP